MVTACFCHGQSRPAFIGWVWRARHHAFLNQAAYGSADNAFIHWRQRYNISARAAGIFRNRRKNPPLTLVQRTARFDDALHMPRHKVSQNGDLVRPIIFGVDNGRFHFAHNFS